MSIQLTLVRTRPLRGSLVAVFRVVVARVGTLCVDSQLTLSQTPRAEVARLVSELTPDLVAKTWTTSGAGPAGRGRRLATCPTRPASPQPAHQL